MQIADLQIHSRYSRATSKNMVVDVIAKQAKIKGLNILGTGDFTHPLWLRELKQKLREDNGKYTYNGINFIPSGEISLMYKQDGRGRRVHHIILAPNFPVVDQINEFLDKKGRRDYDGRPIFGFSSIELVDELMKVSKDIEIIPAHAWTPWFGIFGSMSGFDSLEECFHEKVKYIHSIETGLSSDPPMNWRLSQLDKITLTSNSDAHSPHPWRLGREANVFNFKEVTYKNIINSLRTKKNFSYTIEVDPNYGKYHYDGHSACNFSSSPQQSRKLRDICPKCGKPLVKGVLHRVEELADRKEGFVLKGAVPFKSLLPLSELLSFRFGQALATKKVAQAYGQLVEKYGSEFNVLLNAEEFDDEKLKDLIIKNRKGKLKVKPGYDGVYGKIL